MRQRFGVALTFDGPVNMRSKQHAFDFNVIDPACPCATCELGEGLTRAALHGIACKETAGAHAISLHNLTYQVGLFALPDLATSARELTPLVPQSTLMHRAREAIMQDRFPQYLIDFFARFFGEKQNYP
jgi:queuine tRNA-ribosyltransferase